MSSDIIHKTTLVKSVSDVFVETTIHSSSNVWNYDNKSRPRHDSVRSFEDTVEGHYSYYVWSISAANHIDDGMMRGAGLTNLGGAQAFKRWINRGRKNGMELPRIVDPMVVHSNYNFGGKIAAPSFLRSEMLGAVVKRLKVAKDKEIVMPETFGHGEFPLWMEANRISICDVKVVAENPSKTNVVRLFLKDGIVYQFSRRSSHRGTYFDATRIKGFRGVKLVKRWLPDSEKP